MTPRTRLFHGLGLNGDDTVEFFAAFELSTGEWNRHFRPEGGDVCLLPLMVVQVVVQHRTYEPMVPITLADIFDVAVTARWLDRSGRPTK